MPATTATLHKDQTRTGGQSGPGDARDLSGSTHVSSDPLTHGVLFHTRSTTRVCKPHGLCVCLSKVSSPGSGAAHTCPDSLETTHTCPRPQSQHTPPETGRARTVRIPVYMGRIPAWQRQRGQHSKNSHLRVEFFFLKTIPQCCQALGSSLLKMVPTFVSRFFKYAKNNHSNRTKENSFYRDYFVLKVQMLAHSAQLNMLSVRDTNVFLYKVNWHISVENN